LLFVQAQFLKFLNFPPKPAMASEKRRFRLSEFLIFVRITAGSLGMFKRISSRYVGSGNKGVLVGKIQCGEAAVVFLSGGVVGAGGLGFVSEAAEGFCGAVGGDFCDSASFAGVPVNGFVF